MSEKKKIPCRVCGKLFVPCAYCQAHADVFRWRNFACSIECAKKYITSAVAYRESQKVQLDNDKSEVVTTEPETTVEDTSETKSTTTKRKYNKKKATEEVVENEIENNETE